MREYNFDRKIERRGTGALKTDRLKERFGRGDLKAAWVADMDFATPDFIVEDIKKRLEHPIFGYTVEPDDYRPAIIDWEKELHEWEIKPEWISYIPGIVKGIGMVLNVFTKTGDNVVIMPPVYHPFRITTEENGRHLINIPLIITENNDFEINYEALKKIPSGGVIIFSNPHNPGGKMWSKEELSRLADIAEGKGYIVISDEIHADMALWGNKHIPYMMASPVAASHSITFCAPSKTFNIPGIVSSFSVVPNDNLREKFYSWLKANELDEAPIFSQLAAISAYRKGGEWRKKLLDYIESNIITTEEYFKKELPEIKALRPDASFLVWLDCKELGLNQEKLVDLFVNHAQVALNDGAMFGKEGEGYMRLNVGMPKNELLDILESIKEGVKSYKNI